MSVNTALYKLLYINGLLAKIPNDLNSTAAPLYQLEQAELLSEKAGLEFLSSYFNMPIIDLDQTAFSVSEQSCKKIETGFLWSHRLCPVAETETTITVATTNPLNKEATNLISFLAGKSVTVALSTEEDILKSIKEHFSEKTIETVQETQTEVRKDRVLVIDDDPDLRDLLSLHLFHEDFEVERAENGLEGLQKLHQTEPDVVLLDLKMPILNGEQFLKKVRRDSKTSTLPVIVFTAVDNEENELNLLELGATDFVSKSSSRQVLTSRIRNVLQ